MPVGTNFMVLGVSDWIDLKPPPAPLSFLATFSRTFQGKTIGFIAMKLNREKILSNLLKLSSSAWELD
jgi:hypothetical protein